MRIVSVLPANTPSTSAVIMMESFGASSTSSDMELRPRRMRRLSLPGFTSLTEAESIVSSSTCGAMTVWRSPSQSCSRVSQAPPRFAGSLIRTMCSW